MKFSRSLIGCLTFSALTSAAFAAEPSTNAAPANNAAPATNAAPAAPAAAKKDAAPAPAPAAAPAPAPTGFTLDVYMKDLTDQLKLSKTEQQEVQADYVNDGPKLKGILNDPSLSPLQQAQQVSDLRNQRNAKIDGLLDDLGRKQLFLENEAKYRVALTMLAADTGLASPTPPASAPAPAKS